MIVALAFLCVGFFIGLKATKFELTTVALTASAILLIIWSLNEQLSMLRMALWIGYLLALVTGYWVGATVRERADAKYDTTKTKLRGH